MLTASLLSVSGSAAHSAGRSTPARSGGAGFGAMLSVELDGVMPLPAAKGGVGTGLVSTGISKEAGKVPNLTQTLLALVDSIAPKNPPQAANPDLANNDSGQPDGYWTPERLKNASPIMPSPTVDPNRVFDQSPPLRHERRIGGVGALPETERTM